MLATLALAAALFVVDDPPPPVVCFWSINCDEWASADLNLSGGVDGDDVWEFYSQWVDGIMIDADQNGCPDADSDGNGICDQCDVWRFWVIFERGE